MSIVFHLGNINVILTSHPGVLTISAAYRMVRVRLTLDKQSLTVIINRATRI